jgi:hypothetical protein
VANASEKEGADVDRGRDLPQRRVRLGAASTASYDSEAVLQEALADFPEVIAGIATDDDAQRALVLVAREIGIPTTGFSLDHLFLDDEGVPVLVEVKRASDTRIRREVVGQMLDYAANASTEWTADGARRISSARATACSRTSRAARHCPCSASSSPA